MDTFNAALRPRLITGMLAIGWLATASAQTIGVLQPLLQKEIGTPGYDFPYSLIAAANGDLLVASTSDKAGAGGVPANYGGEDFVLWRLDKNLNVRWVRAYGGNANDRLLDLAEASNGNILLVGRSVSPISGTKTAPNLGGNDIWAVMVDANGQKLWERTFGGDGDDRGLGVLRLASDDFVIVGVSASLPNTAAAGKALPNYGGEDAYAVCVTASGAQRWEICYGGLDYDDFRSAILTSSGSIVLVGSSSSPTGGRANKTAPLIGKTDIYCLAIDTAGRQLWQRTYGEVGHSFSCDTRGAVATENGGFLIAASRGIPLGDINDPNAEWLSSGLVVQFDSLGKVITTQTLANPNASLTGHSFAIDGIYLNRLIALRGGGFLVAGGTDSVAGGFQVQDAFGYADALLVQLDNQLNPVASGVLGGTSNEWIPAITQMPDGAICAAIESWSDKGGNKTVAGLGDFDGWLVTLAPFLADRLEIFPAVELHFTTSLGSTYQLLRSTNMQSWADYGTPFAGTGSTTTNLVSVLGSQTSFWKLKKL